MTNQTFNLDLIPQGVPPIVHVSQYDKGQTWEIHLYENGIVFPVPANTSAAIQGTKPDSTGFQFPAVITAGDNVVTFTLEQQMTVFSGDIDCELVLVNGDDQVATINFILSVEPTTLDDDTVISETQLPLIEQAAELGAVINNYATQIHADAETASTAATTATAAATSASADATTATAAADDATASQTAAATSASNAATSETNAAASASSAAQEATNAAASAAAAQAAIATDMTGATASTAGTHGLVPAPSAGDNTKFLGGDGTWKTVPAALSGLTDVVLINPADGQLLRYNATVQKWENAGVVTSATQNDGDLITSGGVFDELSALQTTVETGYIDADKALIKTTVAQGVADLSNKNIQESVQVNISSTLAGYTPIAFSWLLDSYAGQTNGYPEVINMSAGNFGGTFYVSAVSGPGQRVHTIKVFITWLKNQ